MNRLIVISLVFLTTACRQHSHREHAETTNKGTATTSDTLAENLARQPRKVYNYSVIAGGVADSHEVQARMAKDAVVAEHYNDINITRLRPALLETPREAYVSYRTNKGIFWTAKPVKLVQNELILSDGSNKIRGRCGNRISDTPKQPVASREPEHDLDEFAYAPVWAVDESTQRSPFGGDQASREVVPTAPVAPDLFAESAPTPAWFTSTPESPMAWAPPSFLATPPSGGFSPEPGPIFPAASPSLEGSWTSPLLPPMPMISPVTSSGSSVESKDSAIRPPVAPSNPAEKSPVQTRLVPPDRLVVPSVTRPITPEVQATPTPEAESIVMALMGVTFFAVGIYKRDRLCKDR